MGDVAHILGVKDGPPVPAGAGAAAGRSSRALQLQALPKEVADLIGTTTKEGGAAELPPQVPASGYAPPPKLSSTGAAAAQASPDTTTTTRKQDGEEEVLVKVGNKFISSAKPCRKWVWAPFSSSSRTDGLLLHHWVRANVEYPDYPYSRFDIHLDPVAYSNDDEYDKHLKDRDWSKSETDQLLQLARIYELRWPIIYDRWMEHFGYTNRACGGTNSSSSSEASDQATTAANTDAPKRRKIEDLQHRYYSVAAILMQTRISHEAAAEAQALASQTAATAAAAATADPTAEDHKRATDALLIETAAARALASADPKHQPVLHNLGSGTSNRVAFDLNYERERRSHMEALWSRTKEEEHEEAELRKELKQVEAQLRKLKKSGAHILAAGGGRGGGAAAAAAGASTSLVSSAASSRAATPVAIGGIGGSSASALDSTTVPSLLDQAFASTAPVAVSGTPYLQSARLVGPSAGGAAGINKTLLNRMDEVLDELDIPEAPLPTKRVCDLYDAVRKDVLTLLILQKTVLQEEGGLESKRLKLAKRSGNARVIDEETLLGIAPPPPQPQTPAAQSSSAVRSGSLSKSARGTGGKGSKGGSAGKSKSKGDSSGKASSSKAGGDGKVPASGAGAVKQAPASANAGGKQPPGGKQALGGKQARKGSTATKKRKRKANTPSNAAALTASAAAATAATAAGAGDAKAASRPSAP